MSLRRVLSAATAALVAAVAFGAADVPAAQASVSSSAAVRHAAVRHSAHAVHTSMLPDTPSDQCSAASYLGDPNLGPADLPYTGVVGRQLTGYQRTGGLQPAAFLARFHPGAGWDYPPNHGYKMTNGGADVWVETLQRGTLLDRYGRTTGTFLAPFESAYAARSIPPSNLNNPSNPADCNYHKYRVERVFKVLAGRVAPWFAQRGDGIQVELVGYFIQGAPDAITVQWLLTEGYLREV